MAAGLELAFVVENGLVVNTNLIWANGGTVGINTSSPTANLHVQGTAYVSSNLSVAGNTYIDGSVIVNGNTTVSSTLAVASAGYIAGGVVVGTGTNEGAGTLNAQNGLYVNGVLQPSGFPSGTLTFFCQTNAPTGWTKYTGYNDVALRLVNGTVGGQLGAYPFSTVFSQSATGVHTLTTAEMPSHLHAVSDPSHDHVSTGSTYFTTTDGTYVNIAAGADYNEYLADGIVFYTTPATTGITLGSAGGDGGHYHNISLVLNYIDVILAQKN